MVNIRFIVKIFTPIRIKTQLTLKKKIIEICEMGFRFLEVFLSFKSKFYL